MFNYQYYFNPSSALCYSIAKLLILLESLYSKESLLTLASKTDTSLLSVSPSYRNRILSGYEDSHNILGTPSNNINLSYSWFAVEQTLEKSIKEAVLDGDKVSCKINSLSYNWSINDESDSSLWRYVYCYWLRRGFHIHENRGVHFRVTEPLGKVFIIDSYRCSCEWGTQQKLCLHLKLIQWYRQIKYEQQL